MTGRRIVIITGMSGSGKSTAARALEDEGFFVVDNLPLPLFPQFLEATVGAESVRSKLAVVADVRNMDLLSGCGKILDQVRAAGNTVQVLFLDAHDDDLMRRFSETRRRHPLAKDGGVAAAIGRERSLLSELRDQATLIIDSSGLTPHQLRTRILDGVCGERERAPMVVQLQSFGFRHGVPPESDVVMDVRFLPNPHFIPALRPLSGCDADVSAYVLAQPACRQFLEHFRALLGFLLPQYEKEGKSYLTLSVGCTGGRHRSVAIVEALRDFVRAEGMTLKLNHRDIDKV